MIPFIPVCKSDVISIIIPFHPAQNPQRQQQRQRAMGWMYYGKSLFLEYHLWMTYPTQWWYPIHLRRNQYCWITFHYWACNVSVVWHLNILSLYECISQSRINHHSCTCRKWWYSISFPPPTAPPALLALVQRRYYVTWWCRYCPYGIPSFYMPIGIILHHHHLRTWWLLVQPNCTTMIYYIPCRMLYKWVNIAIHNNNNHRIHHQRHPPNRPYCIVPSWTWYRYFWPVVIEIIGFACPWCIIPIPTTTVVVVTRISMRLIQNWNPFVPHKKYGTWHHPNWRPIRNDNMILKHGMKRGPMNVPNSFVLIISPSQHHHRIVVMIKIVLLLVDRPYFDTYWPWRYRIVMPTISYFDEKWPFPYPVSCPVWNLIRWSTIWSVRTYNNRTKRRRRSRKNRTLKKYTMMIMKKERVRLLKKLNHPIPSWR